MTGRKKGLIAFIVAVLLAIPFSILATTFPKTSGTLVVPGLTASVEIFRDKIGVPHIKAESFIDGAFALGFVHAQDRFFQMELTRRVGAGRLSELIGIKGLSSDRHMRTLGLYRLARAQVAAASPELRRRLDAYAAGVNAWLEQKPWPRAVEFLAFPNFSPEPWKPADSLIWGKLMAVRLSNNWRTENLRMQMLDRLSLNQIDFLWPKDRPDIATVWPDLSGATSLTPSIPEMAWDIRTMGAPSTASNAWVVRSGNSPTGVLSLVNDPHLEFQAPILWYLAKIETTSGILAGATVPGVPFVIIGHNERIAWGFTTTGADTEDLIIERKSVGAETYVTSDGTRAFLVREERLLADDEEHFIQIRETAEGPVISSATSANILTLSAPYLKPGDMTPDALLALNQAQSKPEIEQALALFHAPVQNVFYATADGDAGFRTVGRIPIRRRGDGRVPLVRADGPIGYQGYIPYADLPWESIDAQGKAILNANNKIVQRDYPYLLAQDWPAPFRADRLSKLLSEPVSDIASPQLDVLSTAALSLVSTAQSVLRHPRDQGQVMTALIDWDGRMSRSLREPLLFHIWALALKRRLFADELGESFGRWHGLQISALLRALSKTSGWCDDITTKSNIENCAQMIVGASIDAEKELDKIDKDLGRLAQWGDFHQATFEHPLFSYVPGLEKVTTLRTATDGGHYTLNRGAVYLGQTKNRFSHRHGAGLRTVFDLSNLVNSGFMIATGQSGNPLSQHYDDQLKPWRDGKFIQFKRGRYNNRRLNLVPLKE